MENLMVTKTLFLLFLPFSNFFYFVGNREFIE